MSFSFSIDYKDSASNARACTIITPHGAIATPIIAPVGTQATVKSLTPDQILLTGAKLILANTYHLYLRPGAERIANAGGIHSFMSCNMPIMTDSGGFQVFSLGSSIRDGVGKIANIFPDETRHQRNTNTQSSSSTFVQIDDEGVRFRSHLDGSPHFLNSEKSIEIQSLIGADFILTFDECTSPLDSYEYTKLALTRTHKWAIRSLEAYQKFTSPDKQSLFIVVQGGAYQDLRAMSAAFVSTLPCFGYSIGGSLGKSKDDMHKVLDWTVPLLNVNAPRHLLGIGEIEDIFQCVERGIDIFDCVIPTRWARTGLAFVNPSTLMSLSSSSKDEEAGNPKKLRINLKNAIFADHHNIPIDPLCDCYTCQRFSRAYISHLYRADELLVYSLVSIHNIHFLMNLMSRIREAICNGVYLEFKSKYLVF